MFSKKDFRDISYHFLPMFYKFNDSCEIVNEASSCNCCERHQKNRPTYSEYLNCNYNNVYNDLPTLEVTCFCNCRHVVRKFYDHRCKYVNSEYEFFKNYIENNPIYEIPMTKEELEKEKQDFKNDETLFFKQLAESRIDEYNIQKYYFVKTDKGVFYIGTDNFCNIKFVEKF